MSRDNTEDCIYSSFKLNENDKYTFVQYSTALINAVLKNRKQEYYLDPLCLIEGRGPRHDNLGFMNADSNYIIYFGDEEESSTCNHISEERIFNISYDFYDDEYEYSSNMGRDNPEELASLQCYTFDRTNCSDEYIFQQSTLHCTPFIDTMRIMRDYVPTDIINNKYGCARIYMKNFDKFVHEHIQHMDELVQKQYKV